MSEADPTGKGQHEMGAKLDAGKVQVMRGAIKYFPRALRAVAAVSMFGASKYAWNGWEEVPDGVQRYDDALGRHQTDESIDGLYTPDSKLLHAAHVAWNALARLDLMLKEGTPLENPDA